MNNMKAKKILIVLGVLLLLAIVFILVRGDEDAWICENGGWVRHGNPKSAMPTAGCLDNQNGNKGEVTKNFTEDIGNGLEKANLISVDNPRPNQEITSPLIIKGRARGSWFFEASFPIELYDKDGKLIGSAVAQAKTANKDGWMTEEFIPFETKLVINNSTSSIGSLIFKKDNPSGLAENDDKLVVPVKLKPVALRTKVQIFFMNDKLDPKVTCDKVFSVEREVDETPAIARAALVQLLLGLNTFELKSGFSTSLNPGVKIKNLTIDNGIAKVDFDEKLEQGVGGSCRVSAIRAQIVETLKQFSTVKDVVISINGNSQDILQP